ncbi:tRNA(fMet)-specific endonuclease VapC [Flagellatimonas centrodinii]|uniref:type II toxin-antitoxin system tRNA(fMet)-specific endonuclease VapC n=1 Tax=Flagellatimonas centrodinii TaxID=2806210 RepID=UPI001FEE9F6C|nr:tRNA(fMet)-specific endonuclease VapC [Flagellatimonas centrodinii]ULQ47707.1 tRNA(fMet)-specific endonuclease VapC [Flagellatimonas centrodinii]
MLRYLLDTNLCIETIRHRPAGLRAAFNRHHGHMGISAVTVMELLYGVELSAQTQRNLADVEGFIARLDVLDYDAAAAAHTAQIRAELKVAGTQIGPYDQMIAGHARSRGLVVVTNNTKEFQRVAGLRIEDWTT